MKKNKKSQVNNYQKFNIELPEVVSMDVHAYSNDDVLEDQLSHLNAEREKAVRSGMDTLPWEIEICYLQRELRIRYVRRVNHEKYSKTAPVSSQVHDVEDFDNFSSQTLN